MATHSSIPAWEISYRGAWQATVHGGTESNNKVYNTVNCRHYDVQQISRTYSSCITKSSHPLKNSSPFPLKSLPINISASTKLTIIDILYKWNHPVFICDLFSTQHNDALRVHQCCHIWQFSFFFLRLNYIPLYACITYSLELACQAPQRDLLRFCDCIQFTEHFGENVTKFSLLSH